MVEPSGTVREALMTLHTHYAFRIRLGIIMPTEGSRVQCGIYGPGYSALTLRQGLEELYANNPEVEACSRMTGKSFFDHDLTHVIFEGDTSIYGKIALKPWILLGTTINLEELKDYAADDDGKRLNKESKALLGGWFIATIKIIFIFLTQFFSICFFRVRKVHRKWPHAAVTVEMLDKKLADPCIDYGINVVSETRFKEKRS